MSALPPPSRLAALMTVDATTYGSWLALFGRPAVRELVGTVAAGPFDSSDG